MKKGVKAKGGTPREFTTITVTDGIAMGHQGMKSSLVSRDCIADSVELTMRGHCYDALVGLAGCDKSLPGMMMSMLRLNVPSVFMYGGSILPGKFHGKDVYLYRMSSKPSANMPPERCPIRNCTISNASPVLRRVRAAGSLRQIRWRAFPKPSGLRCPFLPVRPRLM